MLLKLDFIFHWVRFSFRFGSTGIVRSGVAQLRPYTRPKRNQETHNSWSSSRSSKAQLFFSLKFIFYVSSTWYFSFYSKWSVRLSSLLSMIIFTFGRERLLLPFSRPSSWRWLFNSNYEYFVATAFTNERKQIAKGIMKESSSSRTRRRWWWSRNKQTVTNERV